MLKKIINKVFSFIGYGCKWVIYLYASNGEVIATKYYTGFCNQEYVIEKAVDFMYSVKYADSFSIHRWDK